MVLMLARPMKAVGTVAVQLTTTVRPFPLSVTLAETLPREPRLSEAACALKNFTAFVLAVEADNAMAD